MAKLKLKQVGSAIGRNKKQKLTIRALGLKRLGDVVVHSDTLEIRGMVDKVSHLLEVETVE
ncbi:MAG: 50S ribosomal protein L30 [Actinomycetota bacterium]|nr:50S ribosomal protein L30 [Actinomycetota bacterium]